MSLSTNSPKILAVSADVLYFHANRLSDDLNRAGDGADVQAAFRAFRKALDTRKSSGKPKKEEEGILVEAGGIEPPSEDLQELATTRLFRDLELALRTPTNRLPKSQPI
jgi:hypothetical protein